MYVVLNWFAALAKLDLFLKKETVELQIVAFSIGIVLSQIASKNVNKNARYAQEQRRIA